jgi:hypothetical protein
VAYQAQKRAKTSNILPITERNGYVIASTGIVAGDHHVMPLNSKLIWQQRSKA